MFGNNPNTAREKRLLTLLPAALVLLVYSFIFAIPAQRQMTELITQLDSAEKVAVDRLTADSAEENLRLNQRRLKSLRADLAANRLRIKELSQAWRNQDSRLETVREITELLERFDLSIVSQAHQTAPVLSTYFQSLADSMNQYAPNSPLEYWQVELKGRYVDVQGFLGLIDLEHMKTFPVSLSMNAAESRNGLHSWKIVFIV